MIHLTIAENKLDEAAAFLLLIPEFANVPDVEMIQRRLNPVPHLVLSAHADGRTVGCTLGYERDGRFYSWLGAIHPDYRRHGVATALADYQEKWALDHGYTSIWMKTRNAFPEMLIMAIRRGFLITGLGLRDEVREHRIILEKKL